MIKQLNTFGYKLITCIDLFLSASSLTYNFGNGNLRSLLVLASNRCNAVFLTDLNAYILHKCMSFLCIKLIFSIYKNLCRMQGNKSIYALNLISFFYKSLVLSKKKS